MYFQNYHDHSSYIHIYSHFSEKTDLWITFPAIQYYTSLIILTVLPKT